MRGKRWRRSKDFLVTTWMSCVRRRSQSSTESRSTPLTILVARHSVRATVHFSWPASSHRPVVKGSVLSSVICYLSSCFRLSQSATLPGRRPYLAWEKRADRTTADLKGRGKRWLIPISGVNFTGSRSGSGEAVFYVLRGAGSDHSVLPARTPSFSVITLQFLHRKVSHHHWHGGCYLIHDVSSLLGVAAT
jgi:hypothetical protein